MWAKLIRVWGQIKIKLKKNISNIKRNDYELNSMDYNNAKKYEHRKYSRYYISLINENIYQN